MYERKWVKIRNVFFYTVTLYYIIFLYIALPTYIHYHAIEWTVNCDSEYLSNKKHSLNKNFFDMVQKFISWIIDFNEDM